MTKGEIFIMLKAYIREEITLPDKKSKEIQRLVDEMETLYVELQTMNPNTPEYMDKLWKFYQTNEDLDIAAKLDDNVGREDYARYCFRYYIGADENEDK